MIINRFGQNNCSCGHCKKQVLPLEQQEHFFPKKENLVDQELLKVRKELFNSEKTKKSSSTKNEPGLRTLPKKYDPNLPNPSLPRLMNVCKQKIQY
jgi:hypothetical protein